MSNTSALWTRRHFLKSTAAIAALSQLTQLGEASDKPTPTKIATFTADMTPQLGRGIYPGYKPLEVIEHPLLAKGVVLEQDGNRYVLCSVDYCELIGESYKMVRQALAQGAATTADRVSLHTVHQHTAPLFDIRAVEIMFEKNPNEKTLQKQLWDPAYLRAKIKGLQKSVARACENFKPIDQVGHSQAKVDRVASNRRLKNADGTITVRWSSCTDPKLIARPEGPIDPYLKTITFAQGEKPIARLHFYATHPQSFYGDPRASWDVPGIARERLQNESGVHEIYFTGCAGDMTMGKYNNRTPEARTALAGRLYQGMKDSTAKPKFLPIEKIVWQTAPLPLPIVEYEEKELICKITNPKLDLTQRVEAAQNLAFLERGGNERWHASNLSIGPVNMVGLPGESVLDYQLFAQSVLPNDFVAVAAYGECRTGYICTDDDYKEGGYEPTRTRVLPGSEAVMKKGIRQVLKK
jgi:hypothetical protein